MGNWLVVLRRYLISISMGYLTQESEMGKVIVDILIKALGMSCPVKSNSVQKSEDRIDI